MGSYRNFGCNFQIFISILLPFVFQAVMGGLASSGMVMIWSIVALCGVLTFARGKWLFMWLGFTLLLISASVAIDDWSSAKFDNPIEIGSKWFFAINGILGGCAIFFIGFYFVNSTARVKKLLADTNRKLQTANLGLSHKNTELVEGLRYAETIQHAINPSCEKVALQFEKPIYFHRPKNYVSGDFLWVTEAAGLKIAACVDCTGHGISGGLLAMMGSCIINGLVHEQRITDPSELLTQLNRIIFERLNQKETGNKDGMEMSVIAFSKRTGQMKFATAGGSIFHYSCLENTTLRYRMNSSHVGGALSNEQQNFTTHSINLEQGDRIFMVTDGYCDQFGGPNNKKFSRSRFKSFIDKTSNVPVSKMTHKLGGTLNEWQGNHPQTDDILVFGFEV